MAESRRSAEADGSISSPISPNPDNVSSAPSSSSPPPRPSARGSESESLAMVEIEDQTKVRLCFICLEEVGGGDGIEGGSGSSGEVKMMKCCFNMVCMHCFTQHVSTQISGGVHIVTCPFCDHTLPHEQVMRVSSERIQKLLLRLKMINSLDHKTQKMCPNCDFVQSTPAVCAPAPSPADTPTDPSVPAPTPGTGVVNCEKCGLRWCFPCHSPAHDGISCEQNQQPEASFVQWKSTIDIDYSPNAQTCPKCFINIQRDGGCSHMRCRRCKTDFCYKCGQPFNHGAIYKLLVGDHYDKYSIVGCPTLLYPESKTKRVLYRALICTVKKTMMAPVLLMFVALLLIMIPALLIFLAPVLIFLLLGRLLCPQHFGPQSVNNDPV